MDTKNAQGRTLCDHGILQTRCALCDGGSICEHDRIRGQCRRCSIGVVFNEYKYRAKKKGIHFTLDRIDFLKMLSLPCHYCGKDSKNSSGGIDRVDNFKGYTDENSVPCCKSCNIWKSNLELGEFLLRIKNIYERNFGDRHGH